MPVAAMWARWGPVHGRTGLHTSWALPRPSLVAGASKEIERVRFVDPAAIVPDMPHRGPELGAFFSVTLYLPLSQKLQERGTAGNGHEAVGPQDVASNLANLLQGGPTSIDIPLVTKVFDER